MGGKKAAGAGLRHLCQGAVRNDDCEPYNSVAADMQAPICDLQSDSSSILKLPGGSAS